MADLHLRACIGLLSFVVRAHLERTERSSGRGDSKSTCLLSSTFFVRCALFASPLLPRCDTLGGGGTIQATRGRGAACLVSGPRAPHVGVAIAFVHTMLHFPCPPSPLCKKEYVRGCSFGFSPRAPPSPPPRRDSPRSLVAVGGCEKEKTPHFRERVKGWGTPWAGAAHLQPR